MIILPQSTEQSILLHTSVKQRCFTGPEIIECDGCITIMTTVYQHASLSSMSAPPSGAVHLGQERLLSQFVGALAFI